MEEAALRERFVVEAAATMADRQACLEAATATQAPTGVRWRGEAIEQYERKRERFQEKLLMLMHLAGGQAARAPEIISIQHRNTANGGIRNVFIDGGMVLYVTAYHKGYEYSEQTKII